MTKSIEFMYLLRPDLKLTPSIMTQLKVYEKFSQRNFISHDWEEIDLEGKYKNEEILLSNTYLNITHNIQRKNSNKLLSFEPEKIEKSDSDMSQGGKVKWVDQELNQNLATFVPDNFKRNNKSPFINLGELDLYSKNPRFYEKSVPISDVESEDLSSIAVPVSSMKRARKKRSSNFSANPIISPKKSRVSRQLSDISKRSRSAMGVSTEDDTVNLNSKEAYKDNIRTVYGYLKLPGSMSKFTRNPNQNPFNLKKQKLDLERRNNLEGQRKLMSNTQSFYLSKKSQKKKYDLKNFSKKVSIMEFVPKKVESGYPEGEGSCDLSGWSSTMKVKTNSNKAQIRAKLAMLRSNSEERPQRR